MNVLGGHTGRSHLPLSSMFCWLCEGDINNKTALNTADLLFFLYRQYAETETMYELRN